MFSSLSQGISENTHVEGAQYQLDEEPNAFWKPLKLVVSEEREEDFMDPQQRNEEQG